LQIGLRNVRQATEFQKYAFKSKEQQ